MRTTALVLAILFTPSLVNAEPTPFAHSNWAWLNEMPKAQRSFRAKRTKVPRVARAAQPTIPVAAVQSAGSWLEANLGSGRPPNAPGKWCGYAMRMEMISLGFGDPGQRYDVARVWCEVGTPAPRAAVGSIFVSRGHVSKVVAGDCPAGSVKTISGNATGRKVSPMCEPLSRAICFRWPGAVREALSESQRIARRFVSMFDSRAQEAKGFFVGLGYAPHVAAAITGHLIAESRLKTQIRGDGGISVGIAQWNGRRLVNLKRFAAERGQDWHDFRTQLAFVDHELRTSERVAFEALQKSKTVKEATVGFMHFERPLGYTPRNPARGHSFDKRLRNATVIYAAWREQVAEMTP